MLVALLWCLLTVFALWLFLTVPWVDLQFVIVLFPDPTHLLSLVLLFFRIVNTFLLRDIYEPWHEISNNVVCATPKPQISLRIRAV